MRNYPTLAKDVAERIATPGLWVDRVAVQQNIDQMIADVGGPDQLHRLRPHVKTHKMAEIVELQVEAGITRCKAATLSEAAMAADAGMRDVLVAHQPVGPKIQGLAELVQRFPQTCFSAIVDDLGVLSAISAALGNAERPFPVRIDVDCGMGRTGVPFGDELDALRKEIESDEGLVFAGLHLYDGHVKDPSLSQRTEEVRGIIKQVRNYLFNHRTPSIVGGGSPSFKVWAEHGDWECSPGTTLLWDYGYGEKFVDLAYRVAAGLVTRVISMPGERRLCLDLGYKALAAESELGVRVFFPEIPNATAVLQFEEHLVVEIAENDNKTYKVGDVFTAIPKHICPTVALHDYATVLEDGQWGNDVWRIAARDRIW